MLAAMAPPGGGRNAFSQRVGACFSTINVTAPNDAQLKRIFGAILNGKLSEFDDEIRCACIHACERACMHVHTLGCCHFTVLTVGAYFLIVL